MQDAVFATLVGLHRIQSDCENVLNGSLCNATNITGYDLFRAMIDSPFNGITGPVAFRGIDRVNMSVEIIQISRVGEPDVIGNYTSTGQLSINYSALVFKTPEIPISAVVPDDTTLTSLSAKIVCLLAALLILASILCMVYFYIHRDEKVIKKASPVFCQLMLVGVILIGAGIIIWSMKQSTASCIAKVWLTVLGFGLIIGNLMAKTYRIFKIFSNIRVTTTAIRDSDLLKFSGIILLIEVILLLTYTFGASIPTAEVVFSENYPLYSYIRCGYDDLEFHQTMAIVLIVFNVFLVILAAIIAYLTRNVDSAYNESRYIGMVVSAMVKAHD